MSGSPFMLAMIFGTMLGTVGNWSGPVEDCQGKRCSFMSVVLEINLYNLHSGLGYPCGPSPPAGWEGRSGWRGETTDRANAKCHWA